MSERIKKILLKRSIFRNVVRKSEPDRRDHQLRFLNAPAKVSKSKNLKSLVPFVYDQGPIGSCTANSAGSMYSAVVRKQSSQLFIPSRLFLYYNTRAIQGTINYDSGASLRDTMKSLRQSGVCDETSWPYQYEKLYQQPSSNCYAEGAEHQAISYAAVAISLASMKNVLNTRPFVLGIMVYSSFFNPSVSKTGNVPVPTKNERLLGGHAILVMGFDDRRKAFLCRNSWGTSWGLKGDFYLPYSYATNRRLAFDAWVLYSAEMPIANAMIIKR